MENAWFYFRDWSVLQVEVRSHPTFRREGDHLFQELNLDFVDAILGTDVRCAAAARSQIRTSSWRGSWLALGLTSPSLCALPITL